MDINKFFESLDFLQNEYIPKKNYPKNAIFSNTYKDMDYVLSKKLKNSDNKKYMILYTEDDVLDCIGIDQELEYINKLDNIKINIPHSVKRNLNIPIIEALKLFDTLANIENQNYVPIDLVTGILPLYFFYDNFNTISKYNLNLLLTPFENNPIKKDLYICQFEYFIKKYIMFRLISFETKHSKITSIPCTVFKEALSSAVINYCSHSIKEPYKNKSDSILEQIFNELILLPLDA